MDKSNKPRVVINFKENGDFFIYSDPQVEVICRQVHRAGGRSSTATAPIRSPRSG